MSRQVAATPEPQRPRLLALELLSGAPMAAMKAFYGKTLDLAILNERPDRFTVEAGETRITFVENASTDPGTSPFYHFAFNIPENKIRQALDWQKARSPVLAIPEQNRAAGYPPEVVDYRHMERALDLLPRSRRQRRRMHRPPRSEERRQRPLQLGGHPLCQRDRLDRRRCGGGGRGVG